MTKRLEKAVLICGRDKGMGGFLCPPTHPMHTYSVSVRYANGREAGSSSIDYFIREDHPWIGNYAAVKRNIESLLARWEDTKPALDSADVQGWILQVLGYFKGCYRNPSVEPKEQWNVSSLIMGDKQAEAAGLDPVNDHAGVHLIRQYYPSFVPTPEHWTKASWGKASVAV